MSWRIPKNSIYRADPRAAVTWLGAVVVLACGVWLHLRGGALVGPRTRPTAATTAELRRDLEWMDQRLATENATGAMDDPLRACRVASLHWNRAVRVAQQDYYREFGSAWVDDREQEYSAFRDQCLRRDESGDVVATLAAARRSLQLARPGPARLRALWFLSQACSVTGQRDEEIGALVEIARSQPHQSWVWRLLAQAYKARGDEGRFELAEEQNWRASAGRPLSAYISTQIERTPYARPAPRPAARPT